MAKDRFPRLGIADKIDIEITSPFWNELPTIST
jgi:hypothetical protein